MIKVFKIISGIGGFRARLENPIDPRLKAAHGAAVAATEARMEATV